MKKILSLLSMLMVTMMAFATDYTDQLTFKLTFGSSPYEQSLPEGTLTVEKRVDGKYKVTACGCDLSTYGVGKWGDLSCDGVEGTTDADGLTTIQVSNPDVSASGTIDGGFALKGESLLVKFNETKAYALFKGKLALNPVVGYVLSTPSAQTKASSQLAAVLPAVARLAARQKRSTPLTSTRQLTTHVTTVSSAASLSSRLVRTSRL